MDKGPSLIIVRQNQPDNSVELTVTVPKARIKQKYQETLRALGQQTEVPGFRRGKAPLNKVEEKLGKEKIYQEVIRTLLPVIYEEAIQQEKIRPIVNPKVTLASAKEEEDWQIKFLTCEAPAVELGNYKEKIRAALSQHQSQIWTPQQTKKTKTKKKPSPSSDTAKITQIVTILNQTVKVVIPKILIEEELNKKLAQLIEKTEKMGLTLDQYLSSLGKTHEQIKKEYEEEVKANWRLELALNKIADEEKITVANEEIEKIIQKAKTEKEKKELARQRYVLASVIRRQKTLEFLQNL